MGLLTILKKLREEEKEMRVLMLGLDGAGKTTVVRKLLHKDVNVIEPTLGFNIDTIQYDLNSESYNVNVWDVGGQKSIRTFWKNYFENTDILVCIFLALIFNYKPKLFQRKYLFNLILYLQLLSKLF